MRVKWLGTASILVETEQATILIDPFYHEHHENFPKFPIENMKNVDAIFITHPHFDHFLNAEDVAKALNKPVYVCQKGISLYEKLGRDTSKLREIKVGEKIQIHDMQIQIFQGKHCVFDWRLILTTIRKMLCIHNLKLALIQNKLNCDYRIGKLDTYTFEISDGKKKLFIMGSANLNRKDVNPHHMDVLIYPYQGRSDMVSYSIPILQFLEPKKVILDHFDDSFPPMTVEMDCQALIQRGKEDNLPFEIVKPEYDSWISI